MSITLFSPAKVNLFLRILRRRDDGYHELASLFQTIALCDTLHVAINDIDTLTSNHPHLPTGPSNLIWKAIHLFRQKTGIFFPVKIELEKCIPVEAGLGGGSSNAATALWAINFLAGSPVSLQEMIAWAAEIGSDVPFFFSTGTAYCTGRGELITSLTPLPIQKIWIFKPVQSLSTPAVYKRLKVENLMPRDPEECLQGFFDGHSHYFNDLEEPAFDLLPSLSQFKESLKGMGFEHVLLSGSGSAFFSLGGNVDLPVCPSAAFQCSSCFINRIEDGWYRP